MKSVVKSVLALIALLAITSQAHAFNCGDENDVTVLGVLWPSAILTGELHVSGIPSGDEAAVLNGIWIGCTIMPRYDESPENVSVINCRSLASTPGTVDMTFYPDSKRVVLNYFKPEGGYLTKVVTGACNKARGLERIY
jgi:hypothetical protein